MSRAHHTGPGDRLHHVVPDEPYTSYAAYLAARGGANAVDRARELGPERVLDQLRRSGLRGRGGAGFPTAVKWSSIKTHPCETRYVVCNAAEGEPGTFKDRYLLRRNPYSTLEGMIIAADVVGAAEIVVAVKASFTRELARLRAAVDEMSAAGRLGLHELRIVEGPDEYLFGEEKALLEVIEGNAPLPREPHYPPYERGLHATPTSPNPAVVNNVETFARVPSIVLHGADSFRAIGTEDTAGPVIFTVCGDVQRPGVYELPAGIPLRRLFDEVAGGPRPGRRYQAAMSGVSSAVILPGSFDVPADFGGLAGIAGLGSAGFIVIDDSVSMTRVLQAVARFLYVESCSQCSACKSGLRLASSAIDDLFDPALASADDLERAREGARHAPQGNRCYLPVQGSIVIPAMMKHFEPALLAQLAAPGTAPPSWPIPKLVDFDEATRVFTYDEHQNRKRPDWSYDEPGLPAGRRDRLAGY